MASDLASNLEKTLRGERNRVLSLLNRHDGIDHSRRKLNQLLADRIATWATEQYPNSVVLTQSLSQERTNAGRPEYLLDMIVFRKDMVRPFIGAEFEWSFARKTSKQEGRVLGCLLPLLLPEGMLLRADKAQKDRAEDLLKIFITCPEIGIFAGYLNPTAGQKMCAKDLIDHDSWILDAFLKKNTLAPFDLLYIVASRRGGIRDHDFDVFSYPVE